MKKRRLVWLAAWCCLAVFIAAQYAGEGSTGVFYRVTGGQNEMYLLGSIHVGSKSMYPLSRAIRRAIDTADVLVFECDTESQEAKQATARMMQGGLRDAVSAECVAVVEQAAQKAGYALASLEGMKPWAVTSTFSTYTAARQMGEGSARRASSIGVEEMVRRQARKQSFVYLETAEEQLTVLDGFSPALQEYLLKDACSAILNDEEDKTLQQWPRWWAAGEADAFAASYLESFAKEKSPALAQEYHDALITRRNRQMAQKLQGLLENPEKQSCFVTVGLMHLVLPGDSIVSELRALGYTVEKIEE